MPPPFKPIDWEKFELYCKAGSTQQKIAKSFGIDVHTLSRRVKEKYGVDYNHYAHSLHSTGELLIEAKQFQKAMDGNIQMLLWLGKVRCGQKEPDIVSLIPPTQGDIDKDHLIMQQQHLIESLKEKLNANESKTE